jgi:glutaredoxin
LDAADPAHEYKRNFLTKLSGETSFPQIFIEVDKAYKYIGTCERLQELVDSDDIPDDVVAKHPWMKTFHKV